MRATILFFCLFATQAVAQPLAAYLGEARPILIFAPDRYDSRLIEQKGRFAIHRREFRDRDVIVIEIGGPFMRAEGRGLPHGPDLRDRFGVADGDFAIVLVGKDGAEKLRIGEVTDPRAIFDAIDAGAN